MRKIFISSSSKDRKAALTICNAIEARGYTCWISSRDVHPGENFQEAIVRAIRGAGLMVLVFSANANNSDEIKKEVALAGQGKLAVIPVRIEDVMPSEALSYEFATRQWIDVFDDWEQAIQLLLAHIVHIMPPPTAEPEPPQTIAPPVPAAQPASDPAPAAEELSGLHASHVEVPETDAQAGEIAAFFQSHLLHLAVGAALLAVAIVGLFLSGFFASGTPAPMTLTPVQASASPVVPGRTFRDCPDICPEMVTLPPDDFTMGLPPTDSYDAQYEQPAHRVSIKYSFAIGKFDVTFDQWDACRADGGCNGYKPDDAGWGRKNRPVINVNWDDANAYLAWLSKKTGKQYRLLSEAEWEYAARAGTTSTYYEERASGQADANCNGCGSQWDNKMTSPVGSFKPNAFGLYDMMGNVRQWVGDCWHSLYIGAPTDGSVWGRVVTCRRVLRGSDFHQSDPRDSAPEQYRNESIGFRVARTLDASEVH